MERISSEKLTYAIVIALAATVLFPILFLPLGRDQGWNAFMGMAFARGEWLYLASADFNMIGHRFWNMALYAFFGNSMMAIRIAELFVVGLALVFLARQLSRVLQTPLWSVAIMFIAFTYASLGYYHTGERDCFVLMFLLQALCLFISDGQVPTIKNKVLCGLMVAAAVMFRQTYAIFAILFVVLFLVMSRGNRFRSMLWLFLGSSVLPVLFAVAYLLKGGLPALYGVYYNLIELPKMTYSSWGMGPFNVSVIGMHFSYAWVMLASAAVLTGVAAFRVYVPSAAGAVRGVIGKIFGARDDAGARAFMFALTAIVSYAIIVFIQGSFQPYHLVVLLSFAGLLVIIAASWIYDTIAEEKRNNMTYGVVMMFVLCCVLFINRDTINKLRIIQENYRGFHHHLLRKDVFSPDAPDYWPQAHRELGTYIATITSHNNRIQMWAMDPDPYFYADRLASTRHFSPMFIWMSNNAVSKQFYREFLEQLLAAPPRVFVVERYDRKLGNPDYIVDDITAYPEVVAFLKGRFRYDRRIGNYDVYRLIP